MRRRAPTVDSPDASSRPPRGHGEPAWHRALVSACEAVAEKIGAERASRGAWIYVARRVATEGGRSDSEFRDLLAATAPHDEWAHDATETLRVWDDSSVVDLGVAGFDARDPHVIADALECTRTWRSSSARKRDGRYFTPVAVARYVVDRCFARLADAGSVGAVLDPAVGAGRFLLEAARYVLGDRLFGIDLDAESVWASRIALVLATRIDAATVCEHIVVGDALSDEFAWPCTPDLIVGNPPWVAFKGRQAEPLAESLREDLRARFGSFGGFPTTQGMFLERACARLVAGGRVALLVPTQVSDLDGYAPTRAAVTRGTCVDAPLEDLGFGRFRDVVEPTLLFEGHASRAARSSASPWAVAGSERRREVVLDPAAERAIVRLNSLARFEPETFGEAGFQTAGDLSKTHLSTWPAGDPRFTVPLREGRDVEAFWAGAPSRALDPDPEALARAGTRLRNAADFERVRVVIRQTARHPIAAIHDPALGFRNSLLAGYTDDPELLVALLNSRLLRAFHMATQRDGRQAVFPQLKVAHLRALPSPPSTADLENLRAISREASAAQRDRAGFAAAFAAETGLAEREAAALLRPVGRAVPERLGRLSRATLDADVRERVAGAYPPALDRARRAHDVFVRVCQRLDTAVDDAYGVSHGDSCALARAAGLDESEPVTGPREVAQPGIQCGSGVGSLS